MIERILLGLVGLHKAVLVRTLQKVVFVGMIQNEAWRSVGNFHKRLQALRKFWSASMVIVLR